MERAGLIQIPLGFVQGHSHFYYKVISESQNVEKEGLRTGFLAVHGINGKVHKVLRIDTG